MHTLLNYNYKFSILRNVSIKFFSLSESVAPSVTPVPIYQDKKVVTDKHLEELQFRPALQTAFGKIRSKSGKRQDLLEKIKTDVTANWEHFKFIFRTLDGSGLGKISIADMKASSEVVFIC